MYPRVSPKTANTTTSADGRIITSEKSRNKNKKKELNQKKNEILGLMKIK